MVFVEPGIATPSSWFVSPHGAPVLANCGTDHEMSSGVPGAPAHPGGGFVGVRIMPVVVRRHVRPTGRGRPLPRLPQADVLAQLQEIEDLLLVRALARDQL